MCPEGYVNMFSLDKLICWAKVTVSVINSVKTYFQCYASWKKIHKRVYFYISVHARINILLNLVTTTGATFLSINKRTTGAIDSHPLRLSVLLYIFSSTMAKEHKEMLLHMSSDIIESVAPYDPHLWSQIKCINEAPCVTLLGGQSWWTQKYH